MSILVDRLVKTYGSHVVVNQVSFEVSEGECFVLLGPSGSGKSTVLRIIAGLVEADAGRVVLHGRDVTRLPPQGRGIGLVFQQYALFGHMTVADNVEFALRIRRVPAEDRRKRRDELLDLVGLVGLERRYPHQLSGGQQQRVALARALAHRPEVLLLDEPFGALDARIRADLRRTLRRIQREVAVTTVFVTHDQEEAFELADRLGVMNFGRLLEVGPPQGLYLRPQTEFVASFLGKANLMVGEVSKQGIRLGDACFPLGTRSSGDDEKRRVQVLFRPEDVAVKLSPEALDWPLIGEGVVDAVDFAGSFERSRLRIPCPPGVRPIAPPVPFGADHMLLEATRSQHISRRFPLHVGDRVWVGVRRVHALVHPGLSFLLLDSGTDGALGALAYGSDLARLCHARVTALVAAGDRQDAARLQRVRETLGSGLAGFEIRTMADGSAAVLAQEADRQIFDLAIAARPDRGVAGMCQALMRAGGHHLLVVPGACRLPRRVLICAAAGEPGKDDLLSAGRIIRHTGASVSVLTVLPAGSAEVSDQVRRFQAAAVRTLSLFGIEAGTIARAGETRETILGELRREPPDLLVVGSPLAKPFGQFSIDGPVKDLLGEVTDVPILIIRSGRSS